MRKAWGVETLKPLDGGHATAFVGGGVALKPVLHSRQFDWLAGVSYELPPVDDLRIPPAPAGWRRKVGRRGRSAWEYLEGEVESARWPEPLRVSDRFHDLVSGVTCVEQPVERYRHKPAARIWGTIRARGPPASPIAQCRERQELRPE